MQFDIAISETPIRDKAVALWYNGHMDQELSIKGLTHKYRIGILGNRETEGKVRDNEKSRNPESRHRV
jgi:hypothetical protein